MAFKGVIPVGSAVVATLSIDASAHGPALLSIAWSAGGSTGEEQTVIVNPGDTRDVTVRPTAPSLLRVFVDMKSESDQGKLSVSPATPATPVTGDTSWVYSVE